MKRWLGLAVLLALLPRPGVAHAETEGRDRPKAQKPPRDPDEEDEAAALVEEMMSEDSTASDLAWLYSNADEFTPSDVTGPPLPAPGLPGPGAGSPRVWDSRWHKASTGNYVLIGVGFGVGLASGLIPASPKRWTGTNAFDEWGRRTLSSDHYDSGRWAQDLSDVLFSFNVAFPLLVDSLIVSYWYRASPEVAQQIAVITFESMAVTTLLQGPTAGFASRERPYGRDCGKSIPNELDHCEEVRRYRSFFSGHSSESFALATTTCSHHLRHQLFGSPTADGLACGVAMASAGTTALMRVVGRQHYLTDVITGAAVGSLVGIGVPWLLHYSGGPESALSNLEVAVTAEGVSVGGAF